MQLYSLVSDNIDRPNDYFLPIERIPTVTMADPTETTTGADAVVPPAVDKVFDTMFRYLSCKPDPVPMLLSLLVGL